MANYTPPTQRSVVIDDDELRFGIDPWAATLSTLDDPSISDVDKHPTPLIPRIFCIFHGTNGVFNVAPSTNDEVVVLNQNTLLVRFNQP